MAHSPSSLNSRCRADSSSISGRAAMKRSHAASISMACAAVAATTATPISVLRCSSRGPVSATAAPGNLRCTSAMSGLTAERFCFSDRTSPSSTSRVRAPTYTTAVPASGARLLPHLECLDHIAHLDVVVANADTAFETFAHLGDVVLEPAQRLDVEIVGHHDPIADQPPLAVAGDCARAHDAAGDAADPRHPEDLPDFGAAELSLLELRLQHALQCRLDLLDGLVDHRVVADVDALALSQFASPAGRPHVEADDDRIGGYRQVDVVLGDRAHAAADDPQHDLLAHIELEQRVLQCLDRAGDVTLDDQEQFLPLARLQRGLQVLQRDPRPPLSELRTALPGLAPLSDLPGHPVVVDDEEAVTGTGNGGQA